MNNGTENPTTFEPVSTWANGNTPNPVLKIIVCPIWQEGGFKTTWNESPRPSYWMRTSSHLVAHLQPPHHSNISLQVHEKICHFGGCLSAVPPAPNCYMSRFWLCTSKELHKLRQHSALFRLSVYHFGYKGTRGLLQRKSRVQSTFDFCVVTPISTTVLSHWHNGFALSITFWCIVCTSPICLASCKGWNPCLPLRKTSSIGIIHSCEYMISKWSSSYMRTTPWCSFGNLLPKSGHM